MDDHPFETPFGSVQTDAQQSYTFGDTVEVVFWGASPRNGTHL